MSKTVIARKFEFCVGHRVLGHEGKCANLHGHNFTMWVKASGKKDKLGRIIDFSVIKKIVNHWLDENIDHNFLIYQKDKEVLKAFTMISQPKKPFVLDFNPTAENISNYLLEDVMPKLFKGTGITITEVTLYETGNCYAESTL